MDHKAEQEDEIEALDSIYCGELESKELLRIYIRANITFNVPHAPSTLKSYPFSEIVSKSLALLILSNCSSIF